MIYRLLTLLFVEMQGVELMPSPALFSQFCGYGGRIAGLFDLLSALSELIPKSHGPGP